MKVDQTPKNNFFKIILFILFLTVILTWQSITSLNDEKLHLNFLNVGQGDAIHIRQKDLDILIDGGPDKKVLEELGNTMPFYDRTIEHVILTHPDADHITGLVDVLKSYEVKNIYLSGTIKSTNIFEEFLYQIELNNIPVSFLQADDELIFGEDFNFLIFWPTKEYVEKEVSNINNVSIVGKLNYKNVSVFFTGDIENDAQINFISKQTNKLKSDILKISHHGSKNATNDGLLEIVNPEMAIISAGKDNRFGHPHKETLNLLEKFQIRTFRTDIDSTISILSNGINFWKE